ncbi:hypothetical protein EDB84DRAFT_1437483 [Lactarius hengduanensis]|nr:hypothetical protein EDB84DRAFT_1437483 [Lactarius hengduanensis]
MSHFSRLSSCALLRVRAEYPIITKVEGLLAIEVVSAEEDLMTNNLSHASFLFSSRTPQFPISPLAGRRAPARATDPRPPSEYYGAIASSSLGGGKRLRPGYVDGRGAVRRMIPGRGSRLRVPRAAPPADARIPVSVEVAEAFAKAWGAGDRLVPWSLLRASGACIRFSSVWSNFSRAMTRPLQFAAAAYLHFVNLESQIRGFV